jgi:hypothetical protein
MAYLEVDDEVRYLENDMEEDFCFENLLYVEIRPANVLYNYPLCRVE